MNSEMNSSFDAISGHFHRIFASDQTSYALQQNDGTYRRKTGLVTPQFLATNLHGKGSIAIYQKNNDQTVKWICYDFDILKHHLGTEQVELAKDELNRTVSMFCEFLDTSNIPYLLEYSGNRGFHIWVTFNECTDFQVAFFALQAIREKACLQYNSDLIGVDTFPSSRMPTSGVGKAVKIPLSKHTKSQNYSILLKSLPSNLLPVGELSEELLLDQIEIISSHRSTTKAELETILNVFFPSSTIDAANQHRIKAIYVEPQGFSINEILAHWQAHPPLAQLSKNIGSHGHLNHYQRRLLVGMLGNVKCDGNITFAHDLLHNILTNHPNYNKEITDKEILTFSSYNFPAQEQIEEAIGIKYERKLLIEELVSACVPLFKSYLDATFDIALKDIDIVRASEINYLYANDEVQAKVVTDELTNRTSEELYVYAKRIIQEPSRSGFYRHIRNEKSKNRILITPDAATRITTSVILKQMLYCLDTVPSGNSHGYKPNKGFAGGYIFKPWLYNWIKFVSNISSAIEDESNQQYFIVKTDISSFYDEIPHDNLKRLLLGGVNPRIDTKLDGLNSVSRSLYENYIDALFRITEMMVGAKKGLPQGPAYARYLAELYLDNLDYKLESYLGNCTLYLYQRYVDDIFFITSSEVAAKDILEKLRQDLALLGLSLNPEKTIVSQICNFSDDFSHYRSQSKYAVDRASREFANATDTQKNLAINEFMALVKSDSCEEDLAFVFSHLTGVENVEQLKREKVLPTIESGTGRGSLYKHLFGFVLADTNNWNLLDSVIKFTELQSEVLTACLITELDENKGRNDLLARLTEELLERFTLTRLVEEHIAFIHITYGIELDISKIPARAFLSCLAASNNGENLQVTSALVAYLNTALNDLKSLDSFVCALYPLCNSIHLHREDLNHLSSVRPKKQFLL